MKKLFFIIPCLFLMTKGMSVWAQASSDKEMHYTLMVYNDTSKGNTVFEENHPLCNTLNNRWNMFITNYRRIYNVSTGFSGQTVEIAKPTIYNAVIKVDKFIRKAVNKGDISKEEAITTLKHIFDCANALAIERDTQSFEKEIANAKTPESIILIFKLVTLEYI